MIKTLLQKALSFAKHYDESKDLSLLNNCENVSQYQEMLRVLNRITLKDLLLDETVIKESFVPNYISAATIVESDIISIGYFFIPAGMKLGLHDHPNMVVTSKVLMGEVKRRALDLVEREKQFELPLNPIFDIEDNPYSEVKLEAILESDVVFTEGEMLNLTPTTGNIHMFTATKDTIILDVLTPYYDLEIRFCNFYAEINSNKLKSTKKLKKETIEEDQCEKGYKTTLIYLYMPPEINFKVLPISQNLLQDDT